MHKWIFGLLVLARAGTALGQTGSSFVTSDGVSRSPAVTLHCVTTNNMAVPCGTPNQPLYITGSGGLATAGNQTSQVQADQAIAAAIGTQQDAPVISGTGSSIALLKGIMTTLLSGVTATPITGMPISRSVSLAQAQSTILFPANPTRHYLAFQAPAGTAVWVNFVGGTASPNGVDCAQLSAGTLYESGQFVTRGSVSIYAPVATSISAWEG
jgi:hypothetical protein